MAKTGMVLRVFFATEAGSLMKELKNGALVKSGKGILGDRYAEDKGAWSGSRPQRIRHLTLISLEAIDRANENREPGKRFLDKDTRRNIIVSGMNADELNQLIGQEFRVGNVQVRGVELCNPCDRPSKLSRKPGFKEAFDGRGGIRAEVLSDGYIVSGSPIRFF